MTNPKTIAIDGATLLLELLIQEGVTQVYGYPGGAVIPIYDALWRMKKDHPDCPLQHWRTTHEQHAVHAADAYARSSGKVGLVFLTSGPGATNGITGIANAYMDSIPLVVIAGQVPTSLMGRDAFQEIDMCGLVTPITKHSFLVTALESLESIVASAFSIASSGRPGPVLIEIPKDILLASYSVNNLPVNQFNPLHASEKEVNYYQLQKAADALTKAKRPVIYAGGGLIHATSKDVLASLAELLDAPVVNTLMGLGSIDLGHPLAYGLAGMHGSSQANLTLSRADVILAIGVRFSDRVLGKPKSFAPQATIIRIDIDPCELEKNITTDYNLIMDAAEALKLIKKRLSPQKHPLWHQECALFRTPLRPELKVLSTCFTQLAERVGLGPVVTDVGQHQMWTAQYFPFKRPRQWITSGGLGTMGFGVGALLGAIHGTPSNMGIPLLITGDGSLRMNLMELISIKNTQVPSVVLILNNQNLGMVRQWQHHFCDMRFSETQIDDGIDLLALVNAMGIETKRYSSTQDFTLHFSEDYPAINQLVVIEIQIDPNLGAYPFVPPNSDLESMCF